MKVTGFPGLGETTSHWLTRELSEDVSTYTCLPAPGASVGGVPLSKSIVGVGLGSAVGVGSPVSMPKNVVAMVGFAKPMSGRLAGVASELGCVRGVLAERYRFTYMVERAAMTTKVFILAVIE